MYHKFTCTKCGAKSLDTRKNLPVLYRQSGVYTMCASCETIELQKISPKPVEIKTDIVRFPHIGIEPHVTLKAI